MPPPPSPLDTALDTAERHIRDVLALALEHTRDGDALVVADTASDLAVTLTEAYRRALPEAEFVQFDAAAPEPVLAAFERMAPGQLVVLIQSTSFRLDAFRIRIELFNRALKVIEHPHLARMPGDEGLIYIDALAYDPAYYRGVGAALKERIDRAGTAAVESGGERLVFPAGLEPAKLNVGDYRAMKNVGGQYPIGEVFTESRDLGAVSGRLVVSHFGDTAFTVNRPERPITLVVERGRVTEALDSTPEFERVLEQIRSHEGEVLVRELGFGLNRALTPERVVSDIGTFERMCGVHLSLGAKHPSYRKPEVNRRTARYHVDVFALTDSVLLDDECVFGGGAWLVEGPIPGA
jgi:hypothetical protein